MLLSSERMSGCVEGEVLLVLQFVQHSETKVPCFGFSVIIVEHSFFFFFKKIGCVAEQLCYTTEIIDGDFEECENQAKNPLGKGIYQVCKLCLVFFKLTPGILGKRSTDHLSS